MNPIGLILLMLSAGFLIGLAITILEDDDI